MSRNTNTSPFQNRSHNHSSQHHRSLTPPWNRKRRKAAAERAAAAAGGPVGTEALAVRNMERNARIFGYPSKGFVHKIEYTLLYQMISEPNVYPEAVVLQEVDEQNYEDFMIVDDDTRMADGTELEPRMSYAQLSALLALSGDKNPNSQQTGNNAKANPSIEEMGRPNPVAERLCKLILQTVVRYSTENDLDRASEIDELMGPVKRYCANRIESNELKSILPLYVGYTASILTGNPLPLLVGTTMTVAATGETSTIEQRNTLEAFHAQTKRKGDVEKASLLEEDDFD